MFKGLRLFTYNALIFGSFTWNQDIFEIHEDKDDSVWLRFKIQCMYYRPEKSFPCWMLKTALVLDLGFNSRVFHEYRILYFKLATLYFCFASIQNEFEIKLIWIQHTFNELRFKCSRKPLWENISDTVI